jgi:GNAT superfamily N-acetyltransferase
MIASIALFAYFARRGSAPCYSESAEMPTVDDVTVRAATAADAPFLLAMARAAYRDVVALQFGGGWDETVHGARYSEKIATLPFRIAELNGEPVATVSSSVHDDHLRVNELVVLPAFQNSGLGSFLLLREIEHARRMGLPVRLNTFRLNRALQFYEHHGFVVTARDDVKIDLELNI